MGRGGELHRVLKPESVQALASVYGAGRTVRVPSTTANASHFEIVIGLEQTNRLVDAFGGNTVYLPGVKPRPTKYGYEKPPTLREVHELTRLGLSAAKIAMRFGCSNRAVYYKRRRLKRLLAKGKKP